MSTPDSTAPVAFEAPSKSEGSSNAALRILGHKFESAWIHERLAYDRYAEEQTSEILALAIEARRQTRALVYAILELHGNETRGERYVLARALLWYSEALLDLPPSKRDRAGDWHTRPS